MRPTDQHQPTGPTTGPMRPLIVVMETIEGQEENPLPEQGKSPQGNDEQDRLPPLPEEEEESGTPPAPSQPDKPDAPELTPPPDLDRSLSWSQARSAPETASLWH